MKTTTFFVLSLLLVASLSCFGLNYNITFTGSGASSTVGDVVVQNLTKGTTVTVPAGNVLNLSDGLSAVEQLNANDETIRVYPNSVGGASTLSFFAKQAGITQINVYSLDGRKVVSISQNLQIGSNSFQVSLSRGSFAIQVIGNEYTYSAKMINQSASLSQPKITYIGTEKSLPTAPQKSKNSALSTTTMTYTTGDRLLYKGTSGSYSTIVTDVPTAGKTINFVFVACTDADDNNYKVVKIGTQTWMAENLKTTKYNDGTSIPNVTDNTEWKNLSTPAYCWYNNDATINKNTYGAMYNWYTITIAKLAPAGWHIPTDGEWTILENYLIANAYNYDGTTTGNKYAKSLAATTNWTTYTGTGAVGNDLSKNNTTGFSALPGGGRYDGGAFDGLGLNCLWCTATEGYTSIAWYRFVGYSRSDVHRNYYSDSYYYFKTYGFYVRCIRD
jgi:uncharacterized protein (TIGR02145 family)